MNRHALLKRILGSIDGRSLRRKGMIVLSSAVVFVVTYLLVLPAFTLDAKSAASQGGIDVPGTEAVVDVPAADEELKEDSEPELGKTETELLDSDESGLEVETDSLSVYGIVETTIEKTVLASDGLNYRITATYGPETGIPEDAELEVEEILPGDQDNAETSSVHDMSYEEYVACTENALGMEEGSAGYIRLFDIRIVDKDDHSIRYQPAEGTVVDMLIELADAEEGKALNVVHFADEDTEGAVVDAETDGHTVSFAADGFSVYSVVSRENVTGDTALDGKTYVLVTNNNALLMGQPHSTQSGRLAAINANPTVGGTLQVNGTVTMWTFEAVPDQPGWYYISDGNGNYLNITPQGAEGGTVTLGSPQAIYVASRGSGDNVLYQLRNDPNSNNSRAVNNYGSNVGNGFGAWKPSNANNANNDWFRLYDMEYLGDIKVTFDANGGNTAAPADVYGLAGDTITLPDYSGTRNGYEFLGWFTKSALVMSDDPNNYFTVYPPGSTYTIPDRNTTLYAVWNSTTYSTAQFYIRLDGRIPNEPGKFSSSAYTGAISITGAIKQHTWIIDSDATKPNNGVYVDNDITDKLNQLPTVDQLVSNINSSANNLGFRVENQDGEIVVSQITNANTNSSKYNVAVGDGLYVLWYVQKPTSSAWHVDGVLLKKSRVNVAYNGNTPDGSSRNVPLGYQVDPGTQIHIGADGSPNGAVKTPTRTGYIFVGWNTKPDGSGDSYSNNDLYTVHEDVTFYAQWSKGTNLMTVSKVNDDNQVLAGASFKLEEKTASGTYIEKANRTTNESGLFTYDQMENDTLYRMTETYAPNGYELQNSFFFKVDVDEHNTSKLNLYVCDENGNHIDSPDWLTISYIGADDPGGNGVARIQFKITDERIKRNVTFIKVDEYGAPLSGAVYTLTGAKGEVTGVLKSESDSSGVFSVDDAVLPYGSYTLTETDAPTTFATHEPVEFTLNDYVSENNHGLTITEDRSECVVEASCDVTSVEDQGLTITTYAYTVKVKDVKQPHIIVTKNVAVDGDLDSNDLNTTIYYALTKKGEEENGYVKKNGEIWIESMQIVNGVPTPNQVVFDGVDYGQYDVWEMALIWNEETEEYEYTRMYNGLVVSDSFQLDTVAAISEDGGNNADVSEEDLEALVAFTNHYGEVTESINFIANKRWTLRDGTTVIDPPEHALIEFTLYREKKDASGQVIPNTLESVRTIELDGIHDPDGEDHSWQAVFKFLPQYDEDGLEYQYKVKETETVEGYYPNEYPREYYLLNNGGTITNRKLTTDVELHKHFEFYPDNPDFLDSTAGLTFKLTLSDGEERTYTLADFIQQTEDPYEFVLTLTDLPLGSYTFEESGQENLFTEDKYNLVYSVSEAAGEGEADGTEQPVLKLELENSYAHKGTLVIKKNSVIHETVDKEPVPASISGKTFQFIVQRGKQYLQENGTLGKDPHVFALSEGQSLSFEHVATGDYTVTELDASVDGYIWDVVGGTRNADGTWSKTVSIANGNGSGEAEFDNRYTKIENGSLTVSKAVSDGPEDAVTKDYKVEITTTRHGDITMWLDEGGNLTEEKTVLTVRSGQPLNFPTVPAGTYTVTEDTVDAAFTDYALDVEYNATYAAAGEEEAQQTDLPLTIHKDGSGSVDITNTYTYLYTPVKITKTVTGNKGDKTLYFGFDLYLEDAESLQPIVIDGVTDSQGKIIESISLKHGEEKLLEKLPKGARLTIVEHNVHYDTTVAGFIGVGDGETEAPLTAVERHEDVSDDTREIYTFVIPDVGATVHFTNDHTVKKNVVLKKIGYDNRDESTWNLAGAVFKIYEDENRTRPVTLEGQTEFESGENGVFYSGKLELGTYYLEETSVPAGYNGPAGLYQLSITETGVTLRMTGVSGQPDLNDWITKDTDQETGDIYTVSIRNTMGYELPHTGGPGTALFYIIGSVLAIGSAVCMIARRRVRREN